MKFIVNKKKSKKLIPLLMFLVIIFIFLNFSKKKFNSYYSTQIDARNKMKVAMEKIKLEKKNRGIKISEFDTINSGLIGEEFTKITTTIGNINSKKATADENMAALLVKIYKDMDLHEGYNVFILATGSFLGLNIASIIAAEEMNLNVKLMTSMGASSYGANNEDFTFPEIIHYLNKEGIIKVDSSLVTLGGYDDVAKDLDTKTVNEILKRYKNIGLNVYVNENLDENIKYKIDLIENFDPEAIIFIGGNITFENQDKKLASMYGVIDNTRIFKYYKSNESVMGYFLDKDVKTLKLLNVKNLSKEYNFNYITNESIKPIYNFYYKNCSNKILLLVIFCSVIYLWKIKNEK